MGLPRGLETEGSTLAALHPDRDRLKPRFGSCKRIAHPVNGTIEQLAQPLCVPRSLRFFQQFLHRIHSAASTFASTGSSAAAMASSTRSSQMNSRLSRALFGMSS